MRGVVFQIEAEAVCKGVWVSCETVNDILA